MASFSRMSRLAETSPLTASRKRWRGSTPIGPMLQPRKPQLFLAPKKTARKRRKLCDGLSQRLHLFPQADWHGWPDQNRLLDGPRKSTPQFDGVVACCA